ncbi:hypothetical protein MPER_11441 [Moniliophthora perniciosa FA553]|nr:hypothetical protein MPER_11441 [Moniliophthora perniciosa FA553]
MNSLFGDNDLVADSEGEDDIYVLPTQKHKETAVNSNESTVSQFTSNQPIATRDTISSFSATAGDISLVANASASSTSTRPRPKPAYKGAPGNDSLSTSSETTNLTTTSNRPKPQPAYKGAVGYEPQPQPAPTYADDFMPLSIADRAKMRNRRSGDVAIVNASPREKAVEPEILELTSDDDELAIQPKKKGKSKAKATRTMPSPSPQPSLPMATSPLIPTSTLPPSDPPILTPSEFSVGLPPIAVMPQVPSSSASSKRKRTPERDDLFGDDELDGLDMDVEPLPAKKAKVKKVKEKKAKKAGDEGAEKSKARPKAKKKEKEKNVKDREIQQNFKSTEFVNDSDDELHLDNAAAGPSGSGSSQSHAWVEADKEPEPPRKKQKSGAKGKEKDNAPNTSRKGRVVVSDDEDEYIDGEQKGKVVVVEIEKKRQAKQCKPVAEPEPSTPGPSSRSDEEDADREVPTKENIDPRPPSDTQLKGNSLYPNLMH